MRVSSVVIAAALLAGSASAQTLTMGNNVSEPNSSDYAVGTTRTAVDLTNPANASGNLTHVTFGWSNSSCSAAAKLKVFRRVGDTFTMVAERGPFDTSANGVDIDLSSSPIPVLEGDLLGVARVAACGNPVVYAPSGIVLHASFLEVAGDATGFGYSDSAVYNGQLAGYGTGTATEVVAGVVHSVASNPGRQGSYYRTLLQMLSYPYGSPVTGRFVFHRKLVPGSPSDPSLAFTATAATVQSWSDILTTMGATGQPGSLDVVLPWGAAMPMIGAQVYNDMGADGTTGFREEAVPTTNQGVSVSTNIFFAGATGFLFGPADATRYRCNIAVRSLDKGVQFTLQAMHADGTAAGSAMQYRYGPNIWDQKSWQDFTGAVLEDGDYVRISVNDGTAIFDGSIVDNVTNDPADVLARVAFAVE
jgi:hypothetical protein